MEAEIYAKLLCENSKWSRTIYTYQQAVVLLMRDPSELSSVELQTIEKLMKYLLTSDNNKKTLHITSSGLYRPDREVPRYKQRIAGKSLPMEKFAIKKSERFITQNNKLTLPAIELMYLWNTFKVLGKHFNLADNVFKLIESASDDLIAQNEPSKYDTDNRALILLLKGACLRQMHSPLQARKYAKFHPVTPYETRNQRHLFFFLLS